MKSHTNKISAFTLLLATAACLLAAAANARWVPHSRNFYENTRMLSNTLPKPQHDSYEASGPAPAVPHVTVPAKYRLYEDHSIQSSHVFDPNGEHKRFSSRRHSIRPYSGGSGESHQPAQSYEVHSGSHSSAHHSASKHSGHHSSGSSSTHGRHGHHGYDSNHHRSSGEYEASSSGNHAGYAANHDESYGDSAVHHSTYQQDTLRKSLLDQALFSTLIKGQSAGRRDLIEQALEQKQRLADLKLESLVSRLKNRLAFKIIENNKRDEERIIYEALQERLNQPNYLDFVSTSLYDMSHDNGYAASLINSYSHQAYDSSADASYNANTHHVVGEYGQVSSYEDQSGDHDGEGDDIPFHYGAHKSLRLGYEEEDDDDYEEDEVFKGNYHQQKYEIEREQARSRYEKERKAKDAEDHYLQYLVEKYKEEKEGVKHVTIEHKPRDFYDQYEHTQNHHQGSRSKKKNGDKKHNEHHGKVDHGKEHHGKVDHGKEHHGKVDHGKEHHGKGHEGGLYTGKDHHGNDHGKGHQEHHGKGHDGNGHHGNNNGHGEQGKGHQEHHGKGHAGGLYTGKDHHGNDHGKGHQEHHGKGHEGGLYTGKDHHGNGHDGKGHEGKEHHGKGHDGNGHHGNNNGHGEQGKGHQEHHGKGHEGGLYTGKDHHGNGHDGKAHDGKGHQEHHGNGQSAKDHHIKDHAKPAHGDHAVAHPHEHAQEPDHIKHIKPHPLPLPIVSKPPIAIHLPEPKPTHEPQPIKPIAVGEPHPSAPPADHPKDAKPYVHAEHSGSGHEKGHHEVFKVNVQSQEGSHYVDTHHEVTKY